MKKKILLALSLCAILVAALRVGGRQATGDTAATGIAFFMPPGNDDFSDLDARDAQNRPIRSANSQQALVTLFRENLLDLTVFASPHAVTQTMSEIELVLHLFNKLVLMNAPIVLEFLEEAIMPPSRRFVHNVHNLWVTFSVGIFAGSLLLCTCCLSKSPRCVNLRC
jgi:hypothetical protein